MNFLKDHHLTYNYTSLSNVRTRFANQRTYLAYTRTGLAISGVAAATGNWWIFLYGISILIISTYQYVKLEDSLSNNDIILINQKYMLVYTVLGLLTIFLQFRSKNPLKKFSLKFEN